MLIIGIWGFWAMPFVLKYSKSMTLAAWLSVQTLCSASLFGAFFYGGVSSGFLPWFLVAVLLGFFYLSEKPKIVALTLVGNIAGFAIASALFGFPQILPPDKLTVVGWITVTAGTIYMSWMACFSPTSCRCARGCSAKPSSIARLPSAFRSQRKSPNRRVAPNQCSSRA